MTVSSKVWVNFDSSPRIIWVSSPVTSISIQDLVDSVRYIEADLLNLSYPKLIDAAGKDFLDVGKYVGITLTLLNAVVAFEARSGPDYVQCKISGGNLVAVDQYGQPMSPVMATAFVGNPIYEASTSPTLVTVSTSGVGTVDEVASAVWNAQSTLYNVSGSLGNKLNLAGDPWQTDINSYASGTAGYKLNTLPTAAQNADAIWTKPINTMTDKTTVGGYIYKMVLTLPKFLGLK